MLINFTLINFTVTKVNSHTLVDRINSFLKYIFNNEYRKAIKLGLIKRIPDGTNGMIGSIRYLLNKYTDNSNFKDSP